MACSPATWMLTGAHRWRRPPGSETSASRSARPAAEHQDRRPHGLHELIGREVFLDRRGVDFDAPFFHRWSPRRPCVPTTRSWWSRPADAGRSTRSRGHPPAGSPQGWAASHSWRPKCGSRPRAGFRRGICSLSTALVRKFFGCEHLQREGVDLVAHGRSQRPRKPTGAAARRAFRRTPGPPPPPRNATLSSLVTVALAPAKPA